MWLSQLWQRLVYSRFPWLFFFYPLGWLFSGIVFLRRRCYQKGYFRKTYFACPIIVVGNISTGGTGKTPTVLWLADFLMRNGYKPGVVSKGYKGRLVGPHLVAVTDIPTDVGDEPLLMARRLSCPVVVSKNRCAGIRMLRNDYRVNIVIMDDGMQHYAVARDFEIAVVDGDRLLGNGQCLPAGPLREPPSRLKTVDWVIAQGENTVFPRAFTLKPSTCCRINDEGQAQPLSAFKGTVHAVAGIGNPSRFFATLKSAGLTVVPHVFEDHHVFTAADFEGYENECIIMTEKDAVKCRTFKLKNAWEVRVVADGLDTLGYELLNRLKGDT